jgi:FHA domain
MLMGCLTRSSTEIVLACRSLVGRSQLAQIRLSEPIVSSEHAVIFWERAAWRVRDLGSLNGTFVNGKQLAPGGARALAVADRLGFGEPDGQWRVASADAPEPYAYKEGDEIRCFGRGGLLLLPDEAAPEASVYTRAGHWVIEHAGVVTETESGDRVTLGSGVWRLLLPEIEAGRSTDAAPLKIAELSIQFRVSKNEEEVEVAVLRGDIRRTLPRHACLYTLLTLARHRMVARHEEETWIHAEDLARRLRCSREKLNVDIHRIRRLFQMAGVHDAVEIVARRNVHELRSGGAAITINGL